MQNQVLGGICINPETSEEFCKACVQAKPQRKRFPHKASNRATKFGTRVHIDLCGKAQVASLSGAQY